jgi:flagellar biosynthesis regulator FlaF
VRKLQQEAEALGEELHSRDNAILTLTTDLAARQREVEALHRDSTALAAAQVQLRAAQKEVDASDLTLQVERASIETAVQEQTSSELKLRRRIVELTGQVGLWVQEVGRQREENEGLQVRCATAQAVQSSGAGSVSRRPGGDEAT